MKALAGRPLPRLQGESVYYYRHGSFPWFSLGGLQLLPVQDAFPAIRQQRTIP